MASRRRLRAMLGEEICLTLCIFVMHRELGLGA